MLSHLRFHRKGTSNPSSPVPEHQLSISPLSSTESPQSLDCSSLHDGTPKFVNSSHAPVLPPISSITSESDFQLETRNIADLIPESRPQQPQRLPNNSDSGFIGGVALRKYRRDVEAQQITSRFDVVDRVSNGHPEDIRRYQSLNSLEATGENTGKGKLKSITSFGAQGDSQSSYASDLGRRPGGIRLPQESPILLSSFSVATSTETQKSKKGLPFLKNPMSTLLMRRRNNQNAPDLHPLPLTKKDKEPIYDPRIKGTRVHDFSAPRKPREAYTATYSTHQTLTDEPASAAVIQNQQTSIQAVDGASSDGLKDVTNLSSPSSRTQAFEAVIGAPRSPSSTSVYPTTDLEHNKDAKVNTEGTPSSNKDEDILSHQDAFEFTCNERSETSAAVLASARTNQSRNISLSGTSGSAIPKHMKSTSSRFSFDMVGAAKQEKLLEERHRQREHERQTTGDDRHRDSRLDAFDEDTFDYDAMIDDDGLEEKIPGVNADLEDEEFLGSEDPEVDPANDQENFAGFIFQRSNSPSVLARPYCADKMMTPRDVDGNAIGFAMSQDTSGTSTFPVQTPPHPFYQGGTNKESPAELRVQDPPKSAAVSSESIDDLYYDDGMIGFEEDVADNRVISSSMGQQPFDESIFDDNDTDQFGRPLPGAFQQAQSLRQATQHAPTLKRESDFTPRLSASSAMSQSTSHISIGLDDTVDEMHCSGSSGLGNEGQSEDARTMGNGAKSVTAYQAALAAAAHRAAATGKFQRRSSPSSASHYMTGDRKSLYDEDDDFGGYDDVNDDLDYGDDAIIAEANASALANDSDGWYGQEFGFYSAPPNSHATSYGAGSSGLKGYEYANGGFFGSGGMVGLNRSTSGRMISREPNLTPITERSEYSNRNSLMSLGYTPLSTSTPLVQSPGLAQLAMMTDPIDDQMTLSALLRLRSRAWGGSQASLASSREGSPRSERGEVAGSFWPNNSLGSVGQTNYGHVIKASTSLAMGFDDELEDTSASGSPTVTMPYSGFDYWQNRPIPEEDTVQAALGNGRDESSIQGQELCATADDNPSKLSSESSLKARFSRGSSNGFGQADKELPGLRDELLMNYHSHKGSADRVSYFKEEDNGETRWVLERRRTVDSGEVQVLEREIIEGRKI